jgi:spore maturation protein CgeB
MSSVAETWDEAKRRLQGLPSPENIQLTVAENGCNVVTVDGVLLHSKYDPQREAARLADAAGGSLGGTVIVYGAGFGYHLQELFNRGAERLIVVEAREDVAKVFFESTGMEESEKCTFFLGRDPEDVANDPAFLGAVRQANEPFRHPPSVRLAPEYYELLDTEIDRIRSRQIRRRITVVSPLYGGSLPVSRYVANALTSMGHRVDFVDNSVYYDAYKSVEERLKAPFLRDRTGGILMLFLSELVLARAVETSSDIVLCLAQAPVQENALTQLRERGVVTAFWFAENYRHLDYWKNAAPLYDFFFTIQEGEFLQKLNDLGVRNCKYIPTGCDPEVHTRLDLSVDERDRYGSDISFAGAGYYNRQQMFEGLVDYDFKIWGTHWEGSLALRPFVQNDGAPFSTEEMVKIINASKISLNLHSSAQHESTDPAGDFVNPRLFEVASCGGFQLVDEREGLHSFFEPDSEIVTFRNLAELREKIDYYLAHEGDRAAIAERAQARALKEHTYRHRMTEMLDFIVAHAGDRLRARPEKEYLTVGEVRQRPDIDPELQVFLDTFPDDLSFNLAEISKKVLEREGELSESEAIFMMLKEVADHPKLVEVPRQCASSS